MKTYLPNKSDLLYFLYASCSQRKLPTNTPKNQCLTLISIAFNNPIVIALQLILIKKYLRDDYSIIIADNSTNPLAKKEIKNICGKLNCTYISIPSSSFLSLDNSESHGVALNWVNKNIIAKCKSKYIGLLDHDIYPFRETTVSSFFSKDELVAGLLQHRDEKWYIWPGFAFYNRDFLQTNKINFMPEQTWSLDTGGRLYFSHYQYLDKKYINSVDDMHELIKEDDGCAQSSSASIIGDWVHTRNASYWLKCSPKEDDIIRYLTEKTSYENLHNEVTNVLL